jgi:hypothetical protein
VCFPGVALAGIGRVTFNTPWPLLVAEARAVASNAIAMAASGENPAAVMPIDCVGAANSGSSATLGATVKLLAVVAVPPLVVTAILPLDVAGMVAVISVAEITLNVAVVPAMVTEEACKARAVDDDTGCERAAGGGETGDGRGGGIGAARQCDSESCQCGDARPHPAGSW